MNENLKKLFEAIKNDPKLVEKFKKCKTPEEAYKVATSVVSGYTIDEFKETMQTIDKSEKAASGDELSEEDLENVAGGSSTEDSDFSSEIPNVDAATASAGI